MSLAIQVFGVVIAGLGTAALASVLTLAAIRVSRAVGFVDRPIDGPHKSHREPIPYGGGAAIFVAFAVPMLAAVVAANVISDRWIADTYGEAVRDLVGGMRLRTGQALTILTGAAALLALGLRDDWKPLGPLVKALLIAAVSFGVVQIGHVRIAQFAGEPASIALTTAWIFVITNAFNFLDNMDGLSAGVAVIGGVFLAVCGFMAGQIFVPALACVFVGSVSGFLLFNFPPARIFMGDAGSLVIGYLLATISVLTSYWESASDASAFALAMPVCVLAVPLYDFVSVVAIRLVEGRSPLRGDQRHFSHRLVERGLSRRAAVLTIYLATATTGLAATLLPHAGLWQTIVVLSIVVMVLCIVAILEMPLRRAT